MRAGDYGTRLELTIYENGSVVDLSETTALQISLKSPSGVVTAYIAVLTTDGTDGKLQYVTQEGNITNAGPWLAQGRITFASSQFYTSESPLLVSEAL